MILTKQEIWTRTMGPKPDIVITPFNEKQLNPNSYNLRLGDKILTYDVEYYAWDCKKKLPLDPKIDNPHKIVDLPKSGMVLKPGELYLAQTVEYTETRNLVPMVEGRSSWGRLGLFIHITAGFGDVGFCGHWTLEMSVVRPLIIYPDVEICQVFFHTLQGAAEDYRSDKYQHNKGVQPSKIWKEFKDVETRQSVQE